MHDSVMRWGQSLIDCGLLPDPCNYVIEVGSYNVNGSLRPIIESATKARYVGVDIREGPGVDFVLPASRLWKLVNRDGVPDLIVCTEMLEHAADWQHDLYVMCDVLRLGGGLILTTRSPGFPKHDYPADYWRFTRIQLHHYLRDMGMLPIRSEDDIATHPGVLMYYDKDLPTRPIELNTFSEVGWPLRVK